MAHIRFIDIIAYVHVPKGKRKRLDAKAEKCILVGYSHEQKGYKCYNPQTREVRVIQDVIFDEEASWYSSLTGTTSKHWEPHFDDEDSVAGSFEADFELQGEIRISFLLSGPQEELSQHDQVVSEEESVLVSPRKRLSHCDKGKLKLLQHGNDEEVYDQSESDNLLGNYDEPLEPGSDPFKASPIITS